MPGDDAKKPASSGQARSGQPAVIAPGTDSDEGGPRRLVPRPRSLLLFTGGFLVLAGLAVYAVDVHNVAGLRDGMAEWDEYWPYVWYHLFYENAPAQWLQWLFLGGLAVTGGAIAGVCSMRGDRRATAFWGLLALGAVLMLMEDAGNVRHRWSEYAMATWTEHGDWPRVYGGLAFFGVMAVPPVYALLRYHDVPRRVGACWRLLLGGFFVYGTVAAASGTKNVEDWYHHAGTWFHQVVLGGHLGSVGQGRWGLSYEDPTGFIIFDTMVEESLELIAATLLLAAALAYLRALQRAARLAVAEPAAPAEPEQPAPREEPEEPPPVETEGPAAGTWPAPRVQVIAQSDGPEDDG